MIETAAGVHRVVNARMADQIRLPGGAGPVHGVALAEEIGMREVIVPETPGVLAAFGLLSAAIEHHHAQTLHCLVEAVDVVAVNRCLEALSAAGPVRMREEGVPDDSVQVIWTADMRYVGQSYDLEIAITAPLTARAVAEAMAAFHALHERVYGYARQEQAVEFVNFRAVHRHPLPGPRLRPPVNNAGPSSDAHSGERRAYFGPGGFVIAPVLDRNRLGSGGYTSGPAIIEQADTTTIIPPGWTALAELAGNLRICRG